MSEFYLFQQHVANRLGVAEERIRDLRGALREGVDWRKQGTRLLFSAAGEAALRELLKIPAPASPDVAADRIGEVRARLLDLLRMRAGSAATDKKGEAGSGSSVAFKVIRCLPNPHYVMCVMAHPTDHPEGSDLVQVRVRDNRLVMPRMVLDCVREASGWVCPRVPRRKGTW